MEQTLLKQRVEHYTQIVGVHQKISQSIYMKNMVGTFTPIVKVDRKGHDVPFVKLSNRVMFEVNRGWFREARLKIKPKNKRYYYI